MFCLPHRLLRAEAPKGHSRCSNKEDNAVIVHHRGSLVRSFVHVDSIRLFVVTSRRRNTSEKKKKPFAEKALSPLSRHPSRVPSTPASRVPHSHRHVDPIRDVNHPRSTPSSSPVSFATTSSSPLAAARRSTRHDVDEYHPRTTTTTTRDDHQTRDDSSVTLSPSTNRPSCGASVRRTSTSTSTTTTRASLTRLLSLSANRPSKCLYA